MRKLRPATVVQILSYPPPVRRLKKDIAIVLLSLAVAAVSACFFLGYIQQEKEMETQDIYGLLPGRPLSVLAINQPASFARLFLKSEKGRKLVQPWIPDCFLEMMRRNHDLPFVLFSFHPEGVVCYVKATRKRAHELERQTLRACFPAYEPQEGTLYNLKFRYYADAGSRFLGCYQHEGLWVASYSKRLLEKVARKQLLPEERYGEEVPVPFSLIRRFDPNATANLLTPSEGWDIEIARQDTVLWRYTQPWIYADLFPGEGSICGFCSFPYHLLNDSICRSLGDSIASRIERILPSLDVTPQASQDNAELYFTFCSPL